MPGPKFTKAVCFVCNKNKWFVDFPEESTDLISTVSKCLFCIYKEKQDNDRDHFNKLILGLSRRMTALERENKDLKEQIVNIAHNSITPGDIVNTDHVNIVNTIDANVDNVNTNDQLAKANSKIFFDGMRDRFEEVVSKIDCMDEQCSNFEQSLVHLEGRVNKLENPWQKVNSKSHKLHALPLKTSTPPPLTLRNKFDVLADEFNVETKQILIGDSIVRGQGAFFCSKKNKKRLVISHSGAKIDKIRAEINTLDISSRQVPIIAHVGSNDVYSKDKRVRSETIMHDYNNLIETIKTKTNKSVMVGILPRIKSTNFENSRAISINSRLEEVCKRNGIHFINMWHDFDQMHFYPDGIHLNFKGKLQYGDILDKAINNYLSVPTIIPNLPSPIPNTSSPIPNIPSPIPNTPSRTPNLPSPIPNMPSHITNIPSPIPNIPSPSTSSPSSSSSPQGSKNVQSVILKNKT